MSYATLMVYVDAHNPSEQRVRLAASLADRFNATLIGISALAIRSTMVVEGAVIEDMTEADVKNIRIKLASRESWFRNTAGAEHRKLEWRPVLDNPTEGLAREARAADLVVIERTRKPGDVYAGLDPGGAILNMGRPVLVVPDGVSSLRAEHVVVGWKDTREARRALQDAIPFLQEAKRVTIVEICMPGDEEKARQDIDDVARYLTRHHISSGPWITLEQEGTGANQLIRVAQDEKADLVVTGAFGHSRLGEWMFGGMTQDLLTMSPICCLMSH
jgi:nucleotide-binding universal stress UspA family protein